MRSLSAAELLALRERGRSATLLDRALLLLGAAEPDAKPEALVRLSIGRRDGRLLALRERTFGPELACVACCPGCGASLEMSLPVEALLASGGSGEDDAVGAEGERALEVDAGGYRVRFRLPASADLAAAGNAPREDLLARCILEVVPQGGEAGSDRAQPDHWHLPPEVVAAVVRGMEEADPLADLRLNLSCPECGEQWLAPFDIVSFFWSEIEAWAERVLREVHALASAYGWSEAEVLTLSPWRRQVYLELAGA